MPNIRLGSFFPVKKVIKYVIAIASAKANPQIPKIDVIMNSPCYS